jgi:ribosomal protein S5
LLCSVLEKENVEVGTEGRVGEGGARAEDVLRARVERKGTEEKKRETGLMSIEYRKEASMTHCKTHQCRCNQIYLHSYTCERGERGCVGMANIHARPTASALM